MPASALGFQISDYKQPCRALQSLLKAESWEKKQAINSVKRIDSVANVDK
jgi:hypothetical protein